MIYIYIRVSSNRQIAENQRPDLERFAAGKTHVKWHEETCSARTQDRPVWNEVDRLLVRGDALATWRLDRLGRSTRALCQLFAEFQERGINLISLREGIDLQTTTGRLIAHILASLAEYENELRRERIIAGMQRAKRQGQSVGGRKRGTVVKATPERTKAARALRAQGISISSIARQLSVSRPTVYQMLKDA